MLTRLMGHLASQLHLSIHSDNNAHSEGLISSKEKSLTIQVDGPDFAAWSQIQLSQKRFISEQYGTIVFEVKGKNRHVSCRKISGTVSNLVYLKAI